MYENLNRYLAAWQLIDPQPLAQRFTSDVYKVCSSNGETLVLKILSPIGLEDERSGRHALNWYNGHGAVQILQHDEGAMLLEYAEGGDLTQLVEDGKDDEASSIIADTLNKLHFASREHTSENLIPLEQRFNSLLRMEKDSALFQSGADVARSLLANQDGAFVLHGDIHHENIMHGKRGWLAIDPKGIRGERAFDAANTLCNPAKTAANPARFVRQAEILSEGTAINPDRLFGYAFAYACLSACWSIEDKQDPAHALAMAEIAGKHLPAAMRRL